MILAFKRRKDCFKLLTQIKLDIFPLIKVRIASRYFWHSVNISSYGLSQIKLKLIFLTFFSQGIEFCLLIKTPPHNYLFILSVLTVAGLIGNSLAFCVLCSAVYSRKSYSYYLRALAIFDSLTLIITGKLTNDFYPSISR